MQTFKKKKKGIQLQWLRLLQRHRFDSLAQVSGLKDPALPQLCVGHICGSDSIPGLGTSICCRFGHKKKYFTNSLAIYVLYYVHSGFLPKGWRSNLNCTPFDHQVFISTRHGSWVMGRISEDGYPWDMVFHTRFSSMLRNVLPRTVVKWMMEQQMNRWFNHENYGLIPQNK